MNAKQKFIILGTTLLLSGCGIYTKYEPQDTVPDNLYGEEAASLSADTTSIADIDWRDFFNDPYLQALMENGNTTYLEVLTARQSLLAAQLSQTANQFKEIQSLINLYQALGGGQEL